MQPRGIRNNNPANIRKGSKWLGLAEEQTDPAFCVFKEVKYGIRALCLLLRNYYKFYKINTIRGIILRFAPDVENDTTSYIEDVCKRTGIDKDKPLDLRNFGIMLKLVKAIIRHENGINPYDDETIGEGLSLAGITKGT